MKVSILDSIFLFAGSILHLNFSILHPSIQMCIQLLLCTCIYVLLIWNVSTLHGTAVNVTEIAIPRINQIGLELTFEITFPNSTRRWGTVWRRGSHRHGPSWL